MPVKIKRGRGNRGAKLGSKFKKSYTTAVCLKPEHYYMLREMADFYESHLNQLAGALVIQEYCRLLSKKDPEKAAQIKDTYENDEKYAHHIIRLAD